MPFAALVADKLLWGDVITPALAKLLAVPIYLMSNNFDEKLLGYTWYKADKKTYEELC
jgi:hypothetical protein